MYEQTLEPRKQSSSGHVALDKKVEIWCYLKNKKSKI